MLNFTVGPVQTDKKILELSTNQLPYFRTTEFSFIMKENEKLLKEFMYAPKSSRVLFVTGSGTAAMEATVMNVFDENDLVLIVNGGSFGQRFVEICRIHGIKYEEIKLDYGQQIEEIHLKQYENKGFTGFLVNLHETSTGVLYDIEIISDFCKRNNLYLICDSISSFLADSFHMSNLSVDAVITGSQKALAIAPGISIIVLNERLIEKIENNQVKSLYFDLKIYLKNGERGQTPFTPAVGILLQLNKRLKMINEIGIEHEIKKVWTLANDFRNRIESLPVKIFTDSLSNAVTPLSLLSKTSAYKVFEVLKDEYNIYVTPNGGDLRDKIFRVGHIGSLTISDNEKLIDALFDMKRRGLI